MQVGSGINSNVRKDSRYNKNIVVENNVFRIFDPRIVNFYSVDNFVFKNNKIEKTNDYITKNPTAKAFITDDSSNVDIKE